MLKWDKDSPTTFKSNGKTVHDYDRRFELEDKQLIPLDRKFRWKMLDLTEEELKDPEVIYEKTKSTNSGKRIKCIETQKVYNSITDAAKETGISRT